MKFRWKWIIFYGSLWLWATVLHAEIYRYVDPSGTIRFTDNLMEVPEAQRKHTQLLPETGEQRTSRPAPPQEPKSDATPWPATSPQTLPKTSHDSSTATDILEEAERLNQERAELDQEFLELVREQSRLANQRPTVRDVETMTRYNEQVTTLNQRTDAYETRRQAFQQKVDDFNQRLRQHLDRPIEPPTGKADAS